MICDGSYTPASERNACTHCGREFEPRELAGETGANVPGHSPRYTGIDAVALYGDGGQALISGRTVAELERAADRIGARSFRFQLSNGALERYIKTGSGWTVL